MTGYKSKRAAAQAKTIDEVNWVDHEPDGRRVAQKFIEVENKKVSERYGYVPKLHPSEWQDKQPAQDKLAQDAFNDWWDSDYDDSTNPYEKDTFAYWAWAGWQAALAQEKNNG